MYLNETIQKHSTNNTKHSKYKYTHYQNTHTKDTIYARNLSNLQLACYICDYFTAMFQPSVIS